MAENNQAPFTDIHPITKSSGEHQERLQESPLHPNVIARTDDHIELGSVEYGKRVVSEQEKLLKELETYNIKVIRHLPVIGHPLHGIKKDDISIHNVVEKLQGTNLNFPPADKREEFSSKASFFIQNLLRYHIDKFTSGERILTDLVKPSQYMFGKSKDSDVSDIYLVDLQLITGTVRSEDQKLKKYNELYKFMRQLEGVSNTSFDQSRQLLASQVKKLYINSSNIRSEILQGLQRNNI